MDVPFLYNDPIVNETNKGNNMRFNRNDEASLSIAQYIVYYTFTRNSDGNITYCGWYEKTIDVIIDLLDGICRRNVSITMLDILVREYFNNGERCTLTILESWDYTQNNEELIDFILLTLEALKDIKCY